MTDPTASEPAAPVVADARTARLLDEVAANATVAPITRLVDGWLAKAAPGLPFRRANAVLPAADAGADEHDAAVALDAVEAWYRLLGQRVLVQVPSGRRGSDALDALLARRGYEVEAPVDVLVAEVVPVADAGSRVSDGLQASVDEQGAGPGGATVDLSVATGIDHAWAARYGDLLGCDDRWRRRTAGYGLMLANLGPAALAATAFVTEATVDGAAPDASPRPIGVGFAVLERGWAGLFGMGTAAGWRRRGVGGALAGALAVEARHQGATHLYLQVEVDNGPAQALYRGLGFARHHGYHYRVSPA